MIQNANKGRRVEIICTIYLSPHLDVPPLVLEVDPGVRVAPDEEGEEETGGGHRDQHQDQAEQAGVASGDKGSVVGPEREKLEILYWFALNCGDALIDRLARLHKILLHFRKKIASLTVWESDVRRRGFFLRA